MRRRGAAAGGGRAPGANAPGDFMLAKSFMDGSGLQHAKASVVSRNAAGARKGGVG